MKKVESIGYSSNRPDVLSSKSRIPFTRCNNLEKIYIADNVIADNVMGGCSLIVDTDNHEYGKKLKKFSMPKRAQINFCEGLESDPTPIKELYFPNGSSCKNFQIINWNKLDKLDIPFVFNGLNPSEYSHIPNYNQCKLLIKNCELLTKVNIRGDVKTINVSTINESGSSKTANVICIENCPELEEVTFPASLEYVGGAITLIDNCPSLKQITFLGERIYFEKDFFDSNGEDRRKFPEGTKIYLPYAKEIYVGDKKYNIPNNNPNNRLSIVEIDYDESENYGEDVKIVNDENKRCFVFQKVLDKNEAGLLLNGNIPGWDAKNGILYIHGRYGEIAEGAFENNRLIKTVVISYSVKKVGERTFANCFYLEGVVFEHDTPKLEKDSFSGCINLLEVVAANFEGNKKAPVVQNKDLIEYAFSKCYNFTGIKVPGEYDEDKDITFVTIDHIKRCGCKNFRKTIIDGEKVYFEKGFFASEYLPVGFKIYLPEVKELGVDCEKILITKEDNNSEHSSNEENAGYEYKAGKKISIQEEGITLNKKSRSEKEKNEDKSVIYAFRNNNNWIIYWTMKKIKPNGKV